MRLGDGGYGDGRNEGTVLFRRLPSVQDALRASSDDAVADALQSPWVYTDRGRGMPESKLLGVSDACALDVLARLQDEVVDDASGFDELVFVPRIVFRVESGCVRTMLGAGLDSLSSLFSADVCRRLSEPQRLLTATNRNDGWSGAESRFLLYSHLPWSQVLGIKVWLGLGTTPFERHALIASIVRSMTVFGLSSREASSGSVEWLESLAAQGGEGVDAAEAFSSESGPASDGEFARWTRSYERRLSEKLEAVAYVRLLRHESEAVRHLAWTAA